MEKNKDSVLQNLITIPITIQSLIDKNAQYRLPFSRQRRYEWSEKQWEILWEDIIKMLKAYEPKYPKYHFIGSLIFQPIILPAGQKSQVIKYWLIDGQQRLTTIFLILCALRDLAQDSHPENDDLAKNSDDFVKNSDDFAKNANDFVKNINDWMLCKDQNDKEDSDFNFCKLQLKREDMEIFKNFVLGIDVQNKKKESKENLLVDAYHYFKQQIEKCCADAKDKKKLEMLKTFQQILLEHFLAVSITLPDIISNSLILTQFLKASMQEKHGVIQI